MITGLRISVNDLGLRRRIPAPCERPGYPAGLAERLARAVGFRNFVVHAYGRLDLQRVHAVATAGPADLRAFLTALRDQAGGPEPTA